MPQELYPSVGDAGLLIFNEEYAVGSDVRPILGIDDYAVDFEILANRPDCLCALGIARETAAALDTTFKAPKTDVTEARRRHSRRSEGPRGSARPVPPLRGQGHQERARRALAPVAAASTCMRRVCAPSTTSWILPTSS